MRAQEAAAKGSGQRREGREGGLTGHFQLADDRLQRGQEGLRSAAGRAASRQASTFLSSGPAASSSRRPVQEAFAHQAPDDLGQRGAVDAGALHHLGLVQALALGDRDQDR
jgi:hypothetical protein